MRTTGAPHEQPPRPRRAPDPEPPHKAILAGLARVWHSERPAVALTRDLVVVVLVISLFLGGLWAYSGQAVGTSPIVVVESGSMMHPDAPFGRIGTIDPGDLVLVKRADDPVEIATAYEGAADTAYGGYGDVIVFQPMGDPAETPIIHRVLTWVEVAEHPDGLRYTYRNHDGEVVSGASSVELPEVGIAGLKPSVSGFVTKGDNPGTNHAADQVKIIPGRLVEPDWIIGVAKGQAPWVGLVKLALTGNEMPVDTGGQCKVLGAWAPCDAWAMLAISLGVIVLVPLGLEWLWRNNEALRRWAS